MPHRDDNPFVPGFGAIPPALTGREAEFADLEAALRRVRRGYYEQPRLVSGDRGLGKTAVLAELTAAAAADGIWTADVEAASVGEPLVPLLRALQNTLRRHDRDVRLGEYAVAALAVLAAFALKHGGLELSVELAERSHGRGGSGDLATDLGDVLEAVAVVASRAHTAILLTVDEIHAMRSAHLAPLFLALQRLARHEPEPGRRLPVLVVLAGLPHALAAMRKASSTYAERVREHPLGLLDDGAVEEALALPAEERGEPLSDEARSILVGAAGGYPYFVQLLGYEAWNAAADRGAVGIDAAAALAGAAAARRQAIRVYESRLAEVPDAEMRYLTAVAALSEADRRSSSIAEQLGGTASEWAWARARLIDRGLLRPAGYGKVAFALPGLAEHVAGR